MKKVRPDALWHKLSDEQLKTLDHWLFEEKLSYQAATVRAQAELGFEGSESSVKRYYTRREKEKESEKYTGLGERAAAVSEAPGDVKMFRGAAMKVMSGFLFEQVQRSPEDIKKVAQVAQLIVQSEHNEVQRELKAEENEIRREALAFAKERHQFALMETALKALPQLKELAEAKKDPHTQRYEENAYWNRARQAMFGMGIDVHPENAEEEAQMMAAQRRREERRTRESDRERDAVTEAQPPVPASRHYPEYLATVAKQELNEWNQCGEYEI